MVIQKTLHRSTEKIQRHHQLCHVADLKSRDQICDESQQKLEDAYKQRLYDERHKVETLHQQMKSLQNRLKENHVEESSLCNKKIKKIQQTAGLEVVKLRNQVKNLQEESVKKEKTFLKILDQQEEEYEMELFPTPSEREVSLSG